MPEPVYFILGVAAVWCGLKLAQRHLDRKLNEARSELVDAMYERLVLTGGDASTLDDWLAERTDDPDFHDALVDAELRYLCETGRG